MLQAFQFYIQSFGVVTFFSVAFMKNIFFRFSHPASAQIQCDLVTESSTNLAPQADTSGFPEVTELPRTLDDDKDRPSKPAEEDPPKEKRTQPKELAETVCQVRQCCSVVSQMLTILGGYVCMVVVVVDPPPTLQAGNTPLWDGPPLSGPGPPSEPRLEPPPGLDSHPSAHHFRPSAAARLNGPIESCTCRRCRGGSLQAGNPLLRWPPPHIRAWTPLPN